MNEAQKNTTLLAAGALVAGYIAYRFIKPDEFAQLASVIQDENLTYPKPYYEILAYNIQSAVWSSWLNEDEQQVIANMLQIETVDDYLYLVLVYGTRNSTGVDTMPTWFPSLFPPMSLPQTLQKYLSKSDLEQINAHFAAKGINFSFIAA